MTGERVDGCNGPYARSISRPVWIRWNRTDAAFDGDAREVYSSPAPTATSRCKHPHRHQGFSSPQAEEKRIGHRPGFASGISVEGLIDLGKPSQWLDPVRPGIPSRSSRVTLLQFGLEAWRICSSSFLRGFQ